MPITSVQTIHMVMKAIKQGVTSNTNLARKLCKPLFPGNGSFPLKDPGEVLVLAVVACALMSNTDFQAINKYQKNIKSCGDFSKETCAVCAFALSHIPAHR
jgi:hypothetical protein